MTNPIATMPIGVAREIARQGEVRLVALMNLATAADLRATTLCGIFGAASIGIGAAILAYLGSDHPEMRLILSGSVAAFSLFIAALVAAVAGAPRDFWIAGGNPDKLRNWSWDNDKWRDEIDMLDATGQRQAQLIAANKKILEDGSKRITWSLLFALASPLLGVSIYFLAPNFLNC